MKYLIVVVLLALLVLTGCEQYSMEFHTDSKEDCINQCNTRKTENMCSKVGGGFSMKDNGTCQCRIASCLM